MEVVNDSSGGDSYGFYGYDEIPYESELFYVTRTEPIGNVGTLLSTATPASFASWLGPNYNDNLPI